MLNVRTTLSLMHCWLEPLVNPTRLSHSPTAVDRPLPSLPGLQSKLTIILQMSLVLVWGARIPLVRIGRIAGQYMKPRSKPTEKHGDETIFAYKGDAINGHAVEDREHDPDRLVQGYFHSAATLNYVRSLLESHFADIHKPGQWDLSFVKVSLPFLSVPPFCIERGC
jgi:3-deoxy-D-arabino-heptulosonate 7-phosphate (DAHP) synthase class II